MQLSKKEKTFFQLFAAFLKSTLNFEDFENSDDHQSLCIFKITACE